MLMHSRPCAGGCRMPLPSTELDSVKRNRGFGSVAIRTSHPRHDSPRRVGLASTFLLAAAQGLGREQLLRMVHLSNRAPSWLRVGWAAIRLLANLREFRPRWLGATRW